MMCNETADGAPAEYSTMPYFIQTPLSPASTHPATVGSNVGSPARAEGAPMPMFLQSPATAPDLRISQVVPVGSNCRGNQAIRNDPSSPGHRHRDAFRANTLTPSDTGWAPRIATNKRSHLVWTAQLNAATSPGAAVAPIGIRTQRCKTWPGEMQEGPGGSSPRRAFKMPPMTTGLFAMEPSDCSSRGRRSRTHCARRSSPGSRKSATDGEAELAVLLASESSPQAEMSRSREVGEVFLPAITMNSNRRSVESSGCGSDSKLPDIVSESLHCRRNSATLPITSRQSIGLEVAQYVTLRRDAVQETFKAREVCPEWVAKHAFEYAVSSPNTFRV
mmetsp:Transcript_2578/g.6781  ORF Transcript_2578/g.6781 Transcript_2578/m.6781 type:complete len:333 (+) Transcript_2578:126-1124(+)